MKDEKKTIEKWVHDLRTSLTLMRCNIELMRLDYDKDHPENAKIKNFMDSLDEQIDMMTKVLAEK